MPNDWGDHGGVEGYRLPGIWQYILERQQVKADAPDPRVWLIEEGPKRDTMIEADRRASASDPVYRRSKCTLPIDRLEAGLPILMPRRSIDCRPIHPNEEPGRQSWPEAKQWPEIAGRSVDWFALHPDDTLVPVHGDADPATYWQ